MTIWRAVFVIIVVIAFVFLLARVGLQMQADYLEKAQHRQAQVEKAEAEALRQQKLKFPRKE